MNRQPSPPTKATSLFPPPPMQYVNRYTKDAVSMGNAPTPPPPITGVYSMFGAQCRTGDAIIRPLEAQGILRLHPSRFDHKLELKKLNMSVLMNYLDLLEILIQCPGTDNRETKIHDLELIFIHIHHLINEYRSHQARESLRLMLELQKRQTMETTLRFSKHLERAEKVVQECLSKLPPDLKGIGVRVKIQSVDSPAVSSGESQPAAPQTTTVCEDKDRVMCDLIDSLVG